MQGPGNEVVRWSDRAMYPAEPQPTGADGTVQPKVILEWMTPNPLRVIATAAGLYGGRVVRSVSEVSQEEALAALEDMMKTATRAPLEFVDLHFLIEGVTRAFTHQLVRQRTAVYVQESMRFAVKEGAALEVALPPSLVGTTGEETPGAERSTREWQRNIWDEVVEHIAQAYLHLVGSGMPAEDARGILPTNITTRVHYKTSLRGLLEHAGMRLCSQAQYEWKMVWAEILNAILGYEQGWRELPDDNHWQLEAIAAMFKPICYQTGKCEFMGSTDRHCDIRDRVEVHHMNGDPPDMWDDINPLEPLREGAARESR